MSQTSPIRFQVRAAALALGALLTGGCSLALDTEKFEQEGEAEECGEAAVRDGSDLLFQVSSAMDHSDRDMFVVVVTADLEPKIVSMARVMGIALKEGEGELDRDNIEVFMPTVFGEAKHRLHVYFERNDQPGFQNGEDPGWIVPVCRDGTASLDLSVDPDGAQNLSDPAPSAADGRRLFTYEFEGFDTHAGRLLEMRLIEEETNRTLGYLKNPAIVDDVFDGAFPGLIEEGGFYRIDFWADNNADGGFDPAPDDHVWRSLGRGADFGLRFKYIHDTDFSESVEWEEAP